MFESNKVKIAKKYIFKNIIPIYVSSKPSSISSNKICVIFSFASIFSLMKTFPYQTLKFRHHISSVFCVRKFLFRSAKSDVTLRKQFINI